MFNASYQAKNGVTLNDHLLVGPKLQADITAILTRWRTYRFVYTADIEKMFRQICVHPDDADLQRIVWRSDPTAEVGIYRLLTVTYGTASAPYLAMRVLRQLGEDEGANFPAAVPIIKEAIYVDDVLFGADEVETLRATRDQLNGIMNRGGFHLRKWAANDDALLTDIPSEEHETAVGHALLDDDAIKVLGITWFPREDVFRHRVTLTDTTAKTKRAVLSFIAKLYDPLGWVAPVIITAKILIQELWLHKIGWDEEVEEEILRRWRAYCDGLSELERVRVPRWLGTRCGIRGVELHEFADASHRAYASVVYVRVFTDDEMRVSLLVAKSKVAPVKTVSIPRLELNAAALLARLLEWAIKTISNLRCTGLRLDRFHHRARVAARATLTLEYVCRKSGCRHSNPTPSVPMEARPVERKSRGLRVAWVIGWRTYRSRAVVVGPAVATQTFDRLAGAKTAQERGAEPRADTRGGAKGHDMPRESGGRVGSPVALRRLDETNPRYRIHASLHIESQNSKGPGKAGHLSADRSRTARRERFLDAGRAAVSLRKAKGARSRKDRRSQAPARSEPYVPF